MSPDPSAENPSPSKGSNPTRPVLLVILVALVGWVAYMAISSSSQNRPTPSNSSPPSVHTPITQPLTLSLSEKAFTIGSGQYRYFKFTIPPQSSEIEVQGRFEASGGSGNDVEVIVLTEDAFTNWQNHHSVPTFYNSGRVTVGTVDAHLPSTGNPATYYLIFNNAFSVLSNKAVSADIAVHYNRTL
jgi:hypothetical protein